MNRSRLRHSWLACLLTLLLGLQGTLRSQAQIAFLPPQEAPASQSGSEAQSSSESSTPNPDQAAASLPQSAAGAEASQGATSPASDSSGSAGLVNNAAQPDAVSAPAPTAAADPSATPAPGDASGSGAANGAAQDGSTAPATTKDCCPPLPGQQQAAAAAAAAAAQSAASAAAIATAEAAAQAAAQTAAQSSLRGPGLTPVPANRRMQPPAPPSPTAIADKKNWEAIDQGKVQIIAVGEDHLDPGMMEAEKNLLQAAYTHGFRNLVIEYPAAKQKDLDQFLKDPTYQNMAQLDLGYEPDIQDPVRAFHKWDRRTQNFQDIDTMTDGALRKMGYTPDQIAADKARMEMYYLWRKAHRMGCKVVAADLDRNTGIDQNGKLVVNSPGRQLTPAESMRFLLSAEGMKKRNINIAAIAAAVTGKSGRTISIGGASHTGFLPNERLWTTTPPSETYPGLNYLWETQYHIPSIALAQSKLTRQGFLAQLGAGVFGPPSNLTPQQRRAWRAQHAQDLPATIAQDPGRAPINNFGKPIQDYIPDAVNRRQMAVPQGP
ncbi:MAG: hypothetical protein PHO89_09910 [Methylacidiphilaceae bacterium]|nr:hypothetical protein [Candidatus Methylacidiphilaceae bacterium]